MVCTGARHGFARGPPIHQYGFHNSGAGAEGALPTVVEAAKGRLHIGGWEGREQNHASHPYKPYPYPNSIRFSNCGKKVTCGYGYGKVFSHIQYPFQYPTQITPATPRLRELMVVAVRRRRLFAGEGG